MEVGPKVIKDSKTEPVFFTHKFSAIKQKHQAELFRVKIISALSPFSEISESPNWTQKFETLTCLIPNKMGEDKRKYDLLWKIFILRKKKKIQNKSREIQLQLKWSFFHYHSNIHPKKIKKDSWKFIHFLFLSHIFSLTKQYIGTQNHVKRAKSWRISKIATKPTNPNRFVTRTKPKKFKKPMITYADFDAYRRTHCIVGLKDCPESLSSKLQDLQI